MKSLLVIAFALAANSAFADSISLPAALSQAQLNAITLGNVSAQDVINWKVGDNANYQVSAGSFGKLGTMSQAVTKDEGAALWVKTDTKLAIQNDTAEMLLNKADGKILKYIHNGKEEALPDDKIEIISQDYADVTVPAGTFKAIHITAKTEKVSKIEIWANPRDTVMSGMIKQTMKTQGIDIAVELTDFKRTP